MVLILNACDFGVCKTINAWLADKLFLSKEKPRLQGLFPLTF